VKAGSGVDTRDSRVGGAFRGGPRSHVALPFNDTKAVAYAFQNSRFDRVRDRNRLWEIWAESPACRCFCVAVAHVTRREGGTHFDDSDEDFAWPLAGRRKSQYSS